MITALSLIFGLSSSLLSTPAAAMSGADVRSEEDAQPDGSEDVDTEADADVEDGATDEATDEAADEAADEADGEYTPPDSAGMGGNVVASDDPDAQRAQAELEGTSLSDAPAGVPERMEPLQAAAWWTLFGTFALATTGGLFVGLSQVEQDNADRLTKLLDDQGNAVPFSEVEDDYNSAISKGETYNKLAIGFLAAGGATLVASIALFAVHGHRKRQARNRQQSRLQLLPGGLEVRF